MLVGPIDTETHKLYFWLLAKLISSVNCSVCSYVGQTRKENRKGTYLLVLKFEKIPEISRRWCSGYRYLSWLSWKQWDLPKNYWLTRLNYRFYKKNWTTCFYRLNCIGNTEKSKWQLKKVLLLVFFKTKQNRSVYHADRG